MLIFCCLPCLFCCFYCYSRWLNLYSWDITWNPTTENLWFVNQKPTRLRWTTVPHYIVIDDMLIFLLFTLFVLLFLLLFLRIKSLLMRYHLISYNQKFLICQSKTYGTEKDNSTWLYNHRCYINFLLFTLLILLFLLPFSLNESLLMRYHLISYNWKPLIWQSKTYGTKSDNSTWLYSYRWYVNILLFTLYILLLLLLFSLTESLLMRYHLLSYNWKTLICQSKTYKIEMDNCTWLYSYTWYVNFLLFTLFILLFLLLLLLTESLLMRYHLMSYDQKPLISQSILPNYIILLFLLLFLLTESLPTRYHLISYDRKPSICQSKTYQTEMDNCTWLHSYRWYVNFLLFTLFVSLFYCYFRGLNLYSWDITWYPTTENLWSVNRKPIGLKGTTLPDYIAIDDMLIFCCLPCIFSCFYCHFLWINLYSWEITWYPTTGNLWYVNQKPMRLRGTTLPDYIVIHDILNFCCLPCLFCCFYCYFHWLNLYLWDITWSPKTRNLWSLNQFSLTI